MAYGTGRNRAGWRIRLSPDDIISDFSDSSPFAIPPTANCEKPGNIVSQINNATLEASISWQAVTGANLYVIRYRKRFTPTWETVTSAQPNVVLTSLLPNTRYEFQVQAYCSIENRNLPSEFSMIQQFNTGGSIFKTENTLFNPIKVYPNPVKISLL